MSGKKGRSGRKRAGRRASVLVAELLAIHTELCASGVPRSKTTWRAVCREAKRRALMPEHRAKFLAQADAQSASLREAFRRARDHPDLIFDPEKTVGVFKPSRPAPSEYAVAARIRGAYGRHGLDDLDDVSTQLGHLPADVQARLRALIDARRAELQAGL